MTTKKPLRAKLATSVSRSAAALSRATGRGDGSVIGGKIGLMIDPNLLANLAVGREIALVSGTNGKTTTTRLTAAALGVLGDVATNSFGANMPTGHTSALARAGETPYAVLEVDEHYLPQVIRSTHPHVVALLNLSRDQLDRAKEVAMMAELWRNALTETPVSVVANADDPMITWAANAAITAGADVTWVAAGQRWRDDSWVCPECGSHIERADEAGKPAALPADTTLLVPRVSAETALPASGTSNVTNPEPASGLGGSILGSADPENSDLGASELGAPTAGASVPGAATPNAPELGGDDEPDGTTSGTDADAPDDLTLIMTIAPVNPVAASPVVPAAAAVPAAEETAIISPVRTVAIVTDPDDWHCTGCELRRPVPSWRVDGDDVIDPAGRRHTVSLALPGRVNRANAATALAVAAQFGVDPAAAAPRLSEVASIAGRYAQVDRDGRNIRLLLAKNPAGWLEAFDMAENAPTLLSINSQDPDGLDTSWLFDVDFSPLRGRPVMITGERAFDLAVRLEVNDVAFTHVKTFNEAVARVPAGRLEVIANYTAFQAIRAELDRVN